MINSKELAIQLATTEDEQTVKAILVQNGLWDNWSYWRPFGGNENNFSTIGNQQGKAEAALVEKLINSVDAIYMKECLIRKIDMAGPNAPQSISEAMRQFFNVGQGQLAFIDTKTRNKMAESIKLCSTGTVDHFNITLADKGEGQTPNRMKDTILSISKNNKLRVPFVQGKFNMGGTGVLPFCGENKFQLVISRRCPEIPNDTNDDSFDMWAFTIVRREDAREGRRSTMFTYLTDENGEILRFNAKTLPIIPDTDGKPHENMEYGTYFKLYNYAISERKYRSNILNDFNYRLSMLMPDLAHPILLRECRDRYHGHTLWSCLSGLQTRLINSPDGILEPNSPYSGIMNIDGQSIGYSIYAFKMGEKNGKPEPKSRNYRESDGILYIINGQTHAAVSDAFFKRKKVGLSYIADSILVIVDCSSIDVKHREDMFMNSRDRIRTCEFSTAIENELMEQLQSNEALKALQAARRAAAVETQLADDKPLKTVIQGILKRSPVLSKIMLQGTTIASPFNLGNNGGVGETFVGKKHPSFFKIKGKMKDGKLIKVQPINHDFRVQFETDVVNDYFSRPIEQGGFKLFMNGTLHQEMIKSLNLLNGTATLTIKFPANIQIGDELDFSTEIDDEYIPQTFPNSFHVTVDKEKEFSHGGPNPGTRTPPVGPNPPKGRQEPAGAAMPNVVEVYKDHWAQHNMTEDSALLAMDAGNGASDYYLNMDNKYLLTELKPISKRDQNKIQLTKARYKYSMTLIGMSVESYYANNNSEEDSSEVVSKVSTMIAPILIPMLNSMADLHEEDF